MSFNTLNLPDTLLKALKKNAYENPTPIQAQAIPLILDKKDLIGQAQTGTGKTAAFALPALTFWSSARAGAKRRTIHTLVLAPTRELALQVGEAFNRYAQYMYPQPRILTIIGGKDIESQIDTLWDGVDIVVATPGRLLDLIRQDEIQLDKIEMLVIDEADKILSLGFADELELLLKHVPTRRQTLLFSATFPEKVKVLTEKVLTDPALVRINQEEPSLERIQQRVIEVNRTDRGQLLRHLFKTESWEKTVVFVATKRGAGNLAAKLKKAKIRAVAFHGDLSQYERVDALRSFNEGRAPILIATDIAARGLDFKDLSHVINFDLPRSPADYIHRIGRTGRVGKDGIAISFISADSFAHFSLIEKRANIQLERETIAGFEHTDEAIIVKGKPPVKGKRKSKKDKLREAAALQNPDESTAEETHSTCSQT